jgi:hypothetical protein
VIEENSPNEANKFFSGIWSCSYMYPSQKHAGEDVSEHYVNVYNKGQTLVFESIPNIEESYLLVRLTINGELATGIWQETTSPTGAYKGAVYEGAVQLIIDKGKKRMDGVGVGPTLKDGKTTIYPSKWEMRRIGQKKAVASAVKTHSTTGRATL